MFVSFTFQAFEFAPTISVESGMCATLQLAEPICCPEIMALNPEEDTSMSIDMSMKSLVTTTPMTTPSRSCSSGLGYIGSTRSQPKKPTGSPTNMSVAPTAPTPKSPPSRYVLFVYYEPIFLSPLFC